MPGKSSDLSIEQAAAAKYDREEVGNVEKGPTSNLELIMNNDYQGVLKQGKQRPGTDVKCSRRRNTAIKAKPTSQEPRSRLPAQGAGQCVRGTPRSTRCGSSRGPADTARSGPAAPRGCGPGRAGHRAAGHACTSSRRPSQRSPPTAPELAARREHPSGPGEGLGELGRTNRSGQTQAQRTEACELPPPGTAAARPRRRLQGALRSAASTGPRLRERVRRTVAGRGQAASRRGGRCHRAGRPFPAPPSAAARPWSCGRCRCSSHACPCSPSSTWRTMWPPSWR